MTRQTTSNGVGLLAQLIRWLHTVRDATRYRWAKLRLERTAHSDEMELWPALIWQLAALLRAGCSVRTAFEYLVADYDSEIDERHDFSDPLAVVRARNDQRLLLRACLSRLRVGHSLTGIERSCPFTREHSTDRAHQLLACWQISDSTGAALVTLLEHYAAHCENDMDAFEARTSALAGPKATGSILSWLPLLGLGLGVLMGTNPLGLLFGSIPGALVGILGIGLALYGRKWTTRLVTCAEKMEL